MCIKTDTYILRIPTKAHKYGYLFLKTFSLSNPFPVEIATRNKKKLAALNKENCEEYPRSNLAQNSSVPRSQEDYITKVSEEIEGGVT